MLDSKAPLLGAPSALPTPGHKPQRRWLAGLSLAAATLLAACGSKPPVTPGAAGAPRDSAGAGSGAGTHLAAHPASAPLAGSGAAAPPQGTASNPASQPPQQVRLRLMAFNDLHGNLEAGRLSLSQPDPSDPQRSLSLPAGGAAALAGLVNALRAQVPHSLLIASGDQVGAAPLISTLLRHESTVDVLNRMGLDIATVGNHEFDAGLPELQRLLAGGCAAAHPSLGSCVLGRHGGARFAVTVSNVRRAGAPVFAPYLIREFEGVKVGFIGAVTRETPSIVSPSGVAGLSFEDEAAALNQAAQALDAQGVRAIVAVVHEGGETGAPGTTPDWNDTRCPNARGNIFAIQRKLSPLVDVVFSAHTHQGYRCLFEGRPVMQALSHGRGLAVVDLAIDRTSGEVDRSASPSHNLPVFNERSSGPAREALLAEVPAPWQEALRRAVPDAHITQRVTAYAELVAPRANQMVGSISEPMLRNSPTDSPAGRLVADAQLAATRPARLGGAELALMNPGGIRTDLPCQAGSGPCSISYGQVFNMQPFGNTLVVMTLSGRELKAVLESQRRANGQPVFLSPSHGLSYRWLSRGRPGQQVADLTLGGRPVTDEQSIRVTVNSFLAEGGDGFSLFRNGRNRRVAGQDVDALVSYLARSPRVGSHSRIQLVED